MPNRTRIVFVDPMDSAEAGRKVAHQGHTALAHLQRLYVAHFGRYATTPPGTPAQRALYIWQHLSPNQRAGSELYILRERRGLRWSQSLARPENLGAYQAKYVFKARPKVQTSPWTLDSLTYDTLVASQAGLAGIPLASIPPSPPSKAKKAAEVAYIKYAEAAGRKTYRPKVRKDWEDEPNELDGPPMKLAQAGEASEAPPPKPKKRGKGAHNEAVPKKRLQIGVWS